MNSGDPLIGPVDLFNSSTVLYPKLKVKHDFFGVRLSQFYPTRDNDTITCRDVKVTECWCFQIKSNTLDLPVNSRDKLG